MADGIVRARIQTSAELSLLWEVRNAINVEIRRISSSGPNVNVLNPLGNSLTLGVFNGPQDARAEYELAATNDCGTVRRTTSVTFGENLNLAIVGIEVIQTIQRHDHTNPSSSDNSVRLVAGKRTIVRAYVDPRMSINQPNVTGELDIKTFGIITGLGGIPPLNIGGVVEARLRNQIDRNNLCHTLNFELPSWCSRTTEITVKVWVRDSEDAPPYSGWRAERSIEVYFHPRSEQIVVRILVQDNRLGLAAPTPGQYYVSLQGARTRFPISEDGFVVHIAPGYETIGTNRNLQTNRGWQNFLDDIDDIADEFVDRNQKWTAVVPNDARYQWNGLATEGSEYPRLIVRVSLPATFAHELAHTFGVGHADCGGPDPDTLDNRLPTQTEDIGMDVAQRDLIPANTSELMSYCTPFWAGLTTCGAPYSIATY